MVYAYSSTCTPLFLCFLDIYVLMYTYDDHVDNMRRYRKQTTPTNFAVRQKKPRFSDLAQVVFSLLAC